MRDRAGGWEAAPLGARWVSDARHRDARRDQRVLVFVAALTSRRRPAAIGGQGVGRTPTVVSKERRAGGTSPAGLGCGRWDYSLRQCSGALMGTVGRARLNPCGLARVQGRTPRFLRREDLAKPDNMLSIPAPARR